VTGIVLDTNVISEPRRPSPEPKVLAWLAEQDVECLYLTATVVGELAHGIAILPSGRRRDQFEAWLFELVRERFAGRILPFDGEAAFCSGKCSPSPEQGADRWMRAMHKSRRSRSSMVWRSRRVMPMISSLSALL
jgi:hypothetical protein